ncbi:MAG: hypothetical protein CMH05_03490 [Marinovum sp.]|nr:hypothetical protein [Marinovum sp.]|tara:strand:+ start:3576 stop:4223 length:648 start_codon:yes stop_codon:yes gene_type:complete
MSIKLNAQSGGSVALDAPTQTTNSEDNLYKLPIADGSAGQVLTTDGSGNLSWVSQPTAGLIVADIIRLNTTINATNNSVDVITSNWERPDESDDVFDKIGAGMSESSGIFTFPVTGIYFVSFIARWYGNGSTSSANHIYIDATVNNSSYNTVAQSAAKCENSGQVTVIAQTMIDITDVSNRKMRFKRYAGNSNQQVLGNSTKNETFVTFIRLGDT